MDKALEQKLVSGIDEVQKWVESSKDFVMEQAPLVVHEMIQWGIYSQVFYIVLALFLIVASCIGLRYSYKFYRRAEMSDYLYDKNFYEGGSIALLVISSIVLLISFICFCVDTHQLVFILCAPRLYILQELGSLLSKFKG